MSISYAEVRKNVMLLEDAVRVLRVASNPNTTFTYQDHSFADCKIRPSSNLQREMISASRVFLKDRITSLRQWFEDNGIDPEVQINSALDERTRPQNSKPAQRRQRRAR
jgi:hypothetical protein